MPIFRLYWKNNELPGIISKVIVPKKSKTIWNLINLAILGFLFSNLLIFPMNVLGFFRPIYDWKFLELLL